MRITDKHVLFWGGVLSNFYEVDGGIMVMSKDGVDEYIVPTSEHVFMYYKALAFDDYESAMEIVNAQTPKEAKKIGRRIKGFDEKIWSARRQSVMDTAVTLKFTRCPEFREMLRKYHDKNFVEASPYDKIWGIGLSEDDPRADDESQWEGLNLLGKSLDKLRALATIAIK